MLINSLLIVLAYLLGSISGALIVSKLMGLPDPRTLGSGNPGATNVLRYSGKKAALITLCLDVLKGAIAVSIAKFFQCLWGICTRFSFIFVEVKVWQLPLVHYLYWHDQSV